MSQRSDLAATGLTAAQVAERIAAGQVNDEGRQPTRTIGQIMLANIATRFNAILGGLFVVIAVVGPVQDGLFGLVLVANSGIGIAQELRAKRTLDRLTVLNAPTAAVLRGGMPERVPAAAVVLDDVVDLHPGDQVVVDGCCCWPGRHRHLPAPFGGGPSDADPADGGPTLPGQIEPVALVTQEEQLRPDGQATLAEGRRIIGNVDRVSRLFLTKTSYAVLIALAVAAAGVPARHRGAARWPVRAVARYRRGRLRRAARCLAVRRARRPDELTGELTSARAPPTRRRRGRSGSRVRRPGTCCRRPGRPRSTGRPRSRPTPSMP